MMTIQQRSDEKRILAFEQARVGASEFLGEGAWHTAWNVVIDGRDLVLRIPKDVAYGKPVPFDLEASRAEYEATKRYYEAVNEAVPGAAPDFFDYHVSAAVTYTVESFAGEPLSFHTLTDAQAVQIGIEVGAVYRKTDQIQHGIDGLGYLTWTEDRGLHGSLDVALHELVREESAEQLADYATLCEQHPAFQDDLVNDVLHKVTTLRNERVHVPSLVNQDASPENILLQHGRVRLIDPYPLVYTPLGMAGNFMNLYETAFVALADTERYRKHRFASYESKLKAIAEGFLTGYSDGDTTIVRDVRGEQFLQLLEMTYQHHQLSRQAELTRADVIRYGDMDAITARLSELGRALKPLALTYLAEH